MNFGYWHYPYANDNAHTLYSYQQYYPYPPYGYSADPTNTRKHQRRQIAGAMFQSILGGANSSSTHGGIQKPISSHMRPEIVIEPRSIGPIHYPNKNDVLCGRGGRINSHPGNVQFRNMANLRKKEYVAKSTRKLEKAHIAADIVRQIRSMDPPGRFLQEENDGSWYEIGDLRAIKKAGQALREANYGDREKNDTMDHDDSNKQIYKNDSVLPRKDHVLKSSRTNQSDQYGPHYKVTAYQEVTLPEKYPSERNPFHSQHMSRRSSGFSKSDVSNDKVNRALSRPAAAALDDDNLDDEHDCNVTLMFSQNVDVAFGRPFVHPLPKIIETNPQDPEISLISGLSGPSVISSLSQLPQTPCTQMEQGAEGGEPLEDDEETGTVSMEIDPLPYTHTASVPIFSADDLCSTESFSLIRDMPSVKGGNSLNNSDASQMCDTAYLSSCLSILLALPVEDD